MKELTLKDLAKTCDINWNEFPIIDWRNSYTIVDVESVDAINTIADFRKKMLTDERIKRNCRR